MSISEPRYCLQTPGLHSRGALPLPLALKPHRDDTLWFSAPFILKTFTEQFPPTSAGSIAAKLRETSMIRVALIPAVPRVGQLGLFSGPRRGQGPSSRCQPSLGSGAGRWDRLAPGALISRAP